MLSRAIFLMLAWLLCQVHQADTPFFLNENCSRGKRSFGLSPLFDCVNKVFFQLFKLLVHLILCCVLVEFTFCVDINHRPIEQGRNREDGS